MVNSIKHLSVNWIDGMKISQKHFNLHTDFVIDGLRDVASLHLNSFNYGLLPVVSSNKLDQNSIFKIYNTLTNDVQLDIIHCSAITPAGYRIELSDYSINLKSLTSTINKSDGDKEEDYFIVISVNPFDKVPYGDIDLQETPPRHPYTLPTYHVQLLPVASFTLAAAGGNYIIIGKAALKGGAITADSHFIPPCTSILSHPVLLTYYGDFAEVMANLQQHSVKIIQKNINNNHNSKLAANVKLLCESLITHIGNIYFHYRNIVPQSAPVYMIDVFAQQSIHLFNTIQSINALDQEEMLNYIFEWSEVAPFSLLNQLSTIVEINYNHTNCGEYLRDIQLLLVNLETIFQKLSELDYIGQRKENIIVNEQEVTPVTKTKRGWSVLD